METIIFYDTKQFERDFFEKELFDKYNLEFKEQELTPEMHLSYLEENAEIISVFTSSRLTAETLYKFKKLKWILLLILLRTFLRRLLVCINLLLILLITIVR